jgi:hypothetical protein
MAKTAMASKYRGRGIDWLRGDEKHEKRRLVTAVSTHGRDRPAAERGGTAELRTQWFRGLTA